MSGRARFRLLAKPMGQYAAKLVLLKVTAIRGVWLDAAASRANAPSRWLKLTNRSNKPSVAGASQPKANGRPGAWEAGAANNRALSPADGRRGVQERNCVSKGFHSFIRLSFHAGSQFLQAVAIAARHGVRGQVQQFADLFKSVFMPDFQHDDFALFHRQFSQTAHRRPFARRFPRRSLEPAAGFQFALQPPP